MAAEQFANQAQTTLAVAIAAGDLSLSVASAAKFPTVPQFRIIVDSEIMIVTAVSGATFTVTRGAEETTAAAHLADATITHVVTAGGLANAIAGTIHRTSDANYDITETAGTVAVWFRALTLSRTGKLPASPSDAMCVEIVDQDGSLGAHNWTIDGNGKTIVAGAAAAATVALTSVFGGPYAKASLRYSADAGLWVAHLT